MRGVDSKFDNTRLTLVDGTHRGTLCDCKCPFVNCRAGTTRSQHWAVVSQVGALFVTFAARVQCVCLCVSSTLPSPAANTATALAVTSAVLPKTPASSRFSHRAAAPLLMSDCVATISLTLLVLRVCACGLVGQFALTLVCHSPFNSSRPHTHNVRTAAGADVGGGQLQCAGS